MAGRWRRLSRANKVRVVFYPSLILGVAGLLGYGTSMPGTSFSGPLPPATEDQKRLADELRADVVALAGGGERSTRLPGSLDRGAAYVEAALAKAGYTVVPMPYRLEDGREVRNLEVTLEGTADKGAIVLVGAHYDSADGAPGADDNASGVAAMLALARRMSGHPRKRSVRFVAFVNEEPPYFWNAEMGSLVYAKAAKARGDRVEAMLSLETVGYFRDDPGSQKYPPVVGWLYPSRGDFIGFVGNTGSRALVREAVGAFRASAKLPSEGAALPGVVQGVGWSDQWSFWQVGYPGVMVTDTAPFRNPNYHTPGDKPDTLDYDRFARVTEGVRAVVTALADK